MECQGGNDILQDFEFTFARVIELVKASTQAKDSQCVISSQAKLGTPILTEQMGPINGDSRNRVQKINAATGLYSSLSRNMKFFAAKVKEPILKFNNFKADPSITQVTTQQEKHKTLKPTQNKRDLNQPLRFHRSIAYKKISQIRTDKEKGIVTCYRCREKNHLSRDCRNSIVCFECGKIGHRSRDCRSVPKLQNPPIPNFPIQKPNQEMEKHCSADEYAMIRFVPNDENKDLQEVLFRSIVIVDERKLGALYIQAHLQQRFPFPGFAWVARAIPNDRYLIDPPNPAWRTTTIELGGLDLGGIRFPVESYNRMRHDIQGHPPIPLWIKIKGLPYRFFKRTEFERLADDLGGGILMEVDPRSGNHYDFYVLRMRVGVCDRDIIPPYRKMKFTDVNGIATFYTLFYEVEDDLNMKLLKEQELGAKRKIYWREKPNEDGLNQQLPNHHTELSNNEAKRGRYGETQTQGETHTQDKPSDNVRSTRDELPVITLSDT
jgi:Zinc knuckle